MPTVVGPTSKDAGYKSLSKRKRYTQRHTALKSERSSWDPHWRDISEQIDPRRSRFLVTDKNRGEKKNQHIINSTPLRAKATLAAGMQGGLSNQSRPWYRFVAPIPQLDEVQAVKEFLHTVENIEREVMARSNIYNGFHVFYGDQGTFSTALMYIEEDLEDVIRVWVFPIGSYCLALSSRGRVDTVYRETTMTVGQIATEFESSPGAKDGCDKCSQAIQEAYRSGNLDQAVPIVHVCEPNPDFMPGRLGVKGKRFVSDWYERDAQDDIGMLRESGYNEFPYMAARWGVTGEDTYGTGGPGMEALGDCRALQLYEERSAQALDKVVNPPLRGPGTLGGRNVGLLPGDYTAVDSMSPGNTIAPIHEIDPAALQAFEVKISTTERRIKASFYADLWLQMDQLEGTMTAREVDERHDEKLMQLGPVTERNGDELHDPALDRIFAICDRRGLFPPAPEELLGMEIKIEYISALAQAQKQIGTLAIERLAAFVGRLAAASPDALDTIDLDAAVREYASDLGVPPAIVRSKEALEAIRAAKQKAKQAAAQQQQLMAAADGAKTLSETSLEGDNALNRLLSSNGAPGVRN